MKTKFFIIIVTLFFISLADGTLYAKNKKSNLPHVLVIGIDGLGAHGLGMAKTPIMDELMKNGAYSLAARTVVPSSSGPAWSSMITGTTVERHGIGNNSWTVDNKLMEPVYKGDHNMFPTIFGEIRDRVPGAVIGAIYHWKSFGNFIEPDVCDLSISAGSEDEAAQKACDFLVENFRILHLCILME